MCSLHFRSDTACTDSDFLYFRHFEISCEVFPLVAVRVCEFFFMSDCIVLKKWSQFLTNLCQILAKVHQFVSDFYFKENLL